MPLTIIGAGFGRTGTLSVKLALNQLGFPCYHMTEMLDDRRNRGHLRFWSAVAHAQPGTQHEWEQVFGRYSAVVDNPACCVWRELNAAYPDAKVLLTVHPQGAEAWYESTRDTIYRLETMWQLRVLGLFSPSLRRLRDVARRLIWQRSLAGTMEDPTRAMDRYRQHIEEVRAAVSPARLLVYAVHEGWDPLCRFLDVPVPGAKFPNVNDRAAMKRRLAGMAAAAYGLLAVTLAGIAGLIYALVRA